MPENNDIGHQNSTVFQQIIWKVYCLKKKLLIIDE